MIVIVIVVVVVVVIAIVVVILPRSYRHDVRVIFIFRWCYKVVAVVS